MSNVEIEAKIEFQEVIGEANSGYQPIRFSRVKYKASPTAHMTLGSFNVPMMTKGKNNFFQLRLVLDSLSVNFVKL